MILRLIFLVFVLMPYFIILIPTQFILTRLNLPFWNIMPRLFYKFLAIFFGIKVKVYGKAEKKYPTLLVANHISWRDIIAIGSVAKISFIAKSEIKNWPLVGFLASLQKTIFVARTKRTDTKRTSEEMAKRLEGGGALVLFAEGGTGSGTHIRAFRSALVGSIFGVMREAGKKSGAKKMILQPLTIAYTKVQGLPVSRIERSKLAWDKSASMGENISQILNPNIIEVSVKFGEPIIPKANDDRKMITKQCEIQVRKDIVALNRDEESS